MTTDKFSPYIEFSPERWAVSGQPVEWAKLAFNASISRDEIVAIYLPLFHLLNLYVDTRYQFHQITDKFLGRNHSLLTPYTIGITGSVAVGKSTIAHILQRLLEYGPTNPKVDLVNTDGFLYPSRILTERGIMHRKGFPESYDQQRLMAFVRDIKSGRLPVKAPYYSHLTYDIIPDQYQVVDQPDILIIEGLNILQGGEESKFVADFFDFSIYVDADEEDLEEWYIQRFMRLREIAFQDESSHFRKYTRLSTEEALKTAREIWHNVNAINLKENIKPIRERAKLILKKGRNHQIERLWLRQL